MAVLLASEMVPSIATVLTKSWFGCDDLQFKNVLLMLMALAPSTLLTSETVFRIIS